LIKTILETLFFAVLILIGCGYEQPTSPILENRQTSGVDQTESVDILHNSLSAEMDKLRTEYIRLQKDIDKLHAAEHNLDVLESVFLDTLTVSQIEIYNQLLTGKSTAELVLARKRLEKSLGQKTFDYVCFLFAGRDKIKKESRSLQNRYLDLENEKLRLKKALCLLLEPQECEIMAIAIERQLTLDGKEIISTRCEE
jgi:hypothetical protein